MAGFGASFAQGFLNGVSAGLRIQEAQERMAELENERSMRDEFKQAAAPLDVDTVYSAPDADGNMLDFADMKAAQAQAEQTGGNAGVQTRFMVGDQSFESMEQAKVGQRILNDPVAVMNRQAEVAAKYGRPDIASQLAKGQSDIIKAGRESVFDNINRALAGGDLERLSSLYSQYTGSNIQFAPMSDGRIQMSTVKNGQATPMGSPVTMDVLAQGVFDTVQRMPDTFFGQWVQEYQLNQEDQRIGQAERGLGLSAGRLAVDQNRLGFDWEKFTNPAPTAVQTTGADGSPQYSTLTTTRLPDGTWGTTGAPILGQDGNPLVPYQRERAENPFDAAVADMMRKQNQGAPKGWGQDIQFNPGGIPPRPLPGQGRGVEQDPRQPPGEGPYWGTVK